MTLKNVRCLERRAMVGGGLTCVGLAAVGVIAGALALTSTPFPAAAADLGQDQYRADDGVTGRGLKLKGRGHTFDVDPPRHPQTVERQPYRDTKPDRDAYSDRDDPQSYDGFAPRQQYDRADRGSLKDDPVGERYETQRYRHREHQPKRRYTYRGPPDDWQGRNRCLPRRLIRRHLRQAGWRGMRRGRARGRIRYVVARQRRTGEIYELAVDRCTGDVISEAYIGSANRGIRRGRFRNRAYREDVVVRW